MSLTELAKKQLDVCGVSEKRMIVGFSGGSDSMALLHTLVICVGADKLCAVHVNHGIRGEEAKRDEEFCVSACKNLGVELQVVRLDIPSLAENDKTGLEECARKYRYRAFFDTAKKKNTSVIATAHNARDNVEAVLFNLCRGSGIKGVAGIPVCRREGEFLIVRPIIKADKADILEYLEKNNLSYVNDTSNDSNDYTRNYIRHEILPHLSHINRNFVENISNCSDILSSTDDYISRDADSFAGELTEKSTVGKEAFLSLHPALRAKVIQRLSGASMSYRMTELITEFIQNGSNGQSMDISADTVLYHNGGSVKFSHRINTGEYRYELHEGENKFPELGFTLYLFYDEGYKKENIYKSLKPTVINRGKLKGNLYIRNRTEGDKYRYGGMTHTPKKMLASKKIPTQMRKNYPAVCDGDTLVCMPAFPPCDGYDGRESESKAVILYKSDL